MPGEAAAQAVICAEVKAAELVAKGLIEAGKLGLQGLLAGLKALDHLRRGETVTSDIVHGKQSVKKLNLQGNVNLLNGELPRDQGDQTLFKKEDMKRLQKSLKSLGVDFAVTKGHDAAGEEVYRFWFKSGDIERVNAAVQDTLKDYDKKPIREVIDEAKEEAAAREAQRVPERTVETTRRQEAQL